MSKCKVIKRFMFEYGLTNNLYNPSTRFRNWAWFNVVSDRGTLFLEVRSFKSLFDNPLRFWGFTDVDNKFTDSFSDFYCFTY